MPAVFTLRDFVRESNRIEGIGRVRPVEIQAHELFLERPPTVAAIEALVDSIAGAALRDRYGMNCRIGAHLPRLGGPHIRVELEALVHEILAGRLTPCEAHCTYKTLHPFMDGNGRSGRALWIREMGGIARVPLGFLHTFYYQSLQAVRGPRR